MFDKTSTIKVKYINPNIPKLERIGGAKKSAWIDVRASKVEINGHPITWGRSKAINQWHVPYKAGDVVFIKLGFAMQLPEGEEALILPRSGTFKNYGFMLTNSMGVIDNAYAGDNDEWGMMYVATRDGILFQYDRVGQFRTIKSMGEIMFEEVETLGNANRGGYGSTGLK